jgi:hypothetical protein
MIDKIIATISQDILDMGWIGRYGGLVRTAVKQVEIDREQLLFVEKRFPVSSTITDKDCWEKGKYMDLIPNSKLASIAYFEQRGAITAREHKTSSGGIQVLEFTAPISFVAWLNLPKLGFSSPEQSYYFEAHALKVLGRQQFVDTELKITNGSIVIDGLHPRNETIFTKYSYEDKLGLLLYPYDFFAINCTIKWLQPSGCLPDVVLDSPLNCESL